MRSLRDRVAAIVDTNAKLLAQLSELEQLRERVQKAAPPVRSSAREKKEYASKRPSRLLGPTSFGANDLSRKPVEGPKAKGYGRSIYWNGDAIRRAADAIRESHSTDSYVMARRALEAAVRTEYDLLGLLPEPPLGYSSEKSAAPQPDPVAA